MAQSGRVSVRVVIDPVALSRMTSTGGMVDKWTKGKAGQVASKARQLAPVKSGRLRGSIKVGQARSTIGRYESGYEVSADAPYARFVHEGTAPHTITGNPLLVFQVGSQTVFTHTVHHPGTRANPFLLRATQAVFAGSR